MSEIFTSKLLFTFMLFFIVLVSFSVNDAFAEHSPPTINEADINYNAPTHTATLTWDFGNRDVCLVKTDIIKYFIDFSDSNKEVSSSFGTNFKEWVVPHMNENLVSIEPFSIIPCKGEFVFSFIDLQLLDDFKGLEFWTSFYQLVDGDPNQISILNEIGMTYAHNDIAIVYVCNKNNPAHYTDIFYGTDKNLKRTGLNADGECDDTLVAGGFYELDYTPVSEITAPIYTPFDERPQTVGSTETKKKSGGGGCSGDCTKPTFYKNEFGKIIVKNGFDFNNNATDVTNYHTPYDLITINTNQTYNMKLKVYESYALRWIQVGFGMPHIGSPFDDAETIGTFYINYDDTLDRIETVDKHTLVDITNATLSMVNCGYTSSECYLLDIDFVYRDQQKNNIVAINAVDYARNSNTHFINDGILIIGESMNEPLISKTTAGKGGAFYPQRSGMVELKLIDYKTDTWQDEYGYLWTSDNYQSFKITSTIPVPIKAPDKITSNMHRDHSEFYRITDLELKRALEIFDSTKLISELPDPVLGLVLSPIISEELKILKTEYNKQISAFTAEKYLMDIQPAYKKIYNKYQTDYEELNKKYEYSLSTLLQQIKELESTIN